MTEFAFTRRIAPLHAELREDLSGEPTGPDPDPSRGYWMDSRGQTREASNPPRSLLLGARRAVAVCSSGNARRMEDGQGCARESKGRTVRWNLAGPVRFGWAMHETDR